MTDIRAAELRALLRRELGSVNSDIEKFGAALAERQARAIAIYELLSLVTRRDALNCLHAQARTPILKATTTCRN
jgi:hypothetical protein